MAFPQSMTETPYTLSRDAVAEARVGRDIAGITADVVATLGGHLRALWLVGSFARGEGGVVERNGELAPYNDYDFVVIVSDVTGRVRSALSDVARTWSSRIGVEVDLWPLEEERVPKVPRTLFWLDITLGGLRVVHGPVDGPQALPRRTVRDLPLEECGRLLANRATGIALSNLEPVDRDLRCARHVHKAVLACGDVRLLAIDRYTTTVQGRLEELRRLRAAAAPPSALVDAYEEGVAFRVRPDLWRPSTGSLKRWYDGALARIMGWHLDFERWRVGAPGTPAEFVDWPARVYPMLPDSSRLSAALAAVRAFVERSSPLLPWLGHPRERLARVAVALAYGAHEPGCRGSAARLLGAPTGADDEELRRRLERLVHRGA